MIQKTRNYHMMRIVLFDDIAGVPLDIVECTLSGITTNIAWTVLSYSGTTTTTLSILITLWRTD